MKFTWHDIEQLLYTIFTYLMWGFCIWGFVLIIQILPNRIVPSCMEDEVIVGVGNFKDGYWDGGYMCIHFEDVK